MVKNIYFYKVSLVQTTLPSTAQSNNNRSRYSVPFFFEPNMHTTIDIVNSCISNEYPAKFSPIIYGEYLLDRVQG